MKTKLKLAMEYRMGYNCQYGSDLRDGYTTVIAGEPTPTGYSDGDGVKSIYLGGPEGEPDPNIEKAKIVRRSFYPRATRKAEAEVIRVRLDKNRRRR